jgi:hypothetical protein
MNSPLQSFLAQHSAQPVHPAIAGMAEQLRTKHGDVLAMLAYGSALRDTAPESTLIDYYVLTKTLADVSASRLSRWMCGRIPPNVYFHEQHIGSKSYRSKYTVLPLALLALKCKPAVSNPYFWVRFAQPMHIIWAADSATRQRVIETMAQAVETSYAHAKQLAPQASPDQQWVTLFEHTYKTELRPESAARPAAIVDQQREYFLSISNLALPAAPSSKAWSTRQWQGKLLSLARLLKAAFTFQGGADYAAWKIKRHSGVEIIVTDWQRRHPVMASVVLLPKLLRKGALK